MQRGKKRKKICIALDSNPRPRRCNLNTLPVEPIGGNRPGAKFRSCNLHRKGKHARKNKTNTDPNPTTNPNPKPTIDKAAKRN